MAEYADEITGKAYAPREYLEHQLAMTDEEKAARSVFFEEFFKHHEGQESHVA